MSSITPSIIHAPTEFEESNTSLEPSVETLVEPVCHRCQDKPRQKNIVRLTFNQFLYELGDQFPETYQTVAEFSHGVSKLWQMSFLVSTALAVRSNILYADTFSEASHLTLGVGIGALASRSIRSVTGHESKPVKTMGVRIQPQMLTSKSLVGAMLITSAAGVFFSAASIVYEAAPSVTLGLLAHYGVRRLQERGFISTGIKEKLQWGVQGVAATVAMLNPVKNVMSLALGAGLGAVSEAAYSNYFLSSDQEKVV